MKNLETHSLQDFSKSFFPPKSPLKKRVLVFGTFDILHPGHIFFLKEAKKFGQELFVLIARDSTVIQKKGRTATFSEEQRKEHIEALGIAEKVLLGDEEDFLKIPKAVDPDIMVFGYDQTVSEKKLQKHFPFCTMQRVAAHFPEHFKSSKLRTLLPENRTAEVFSPLSGIV